METSREAGETVLLRRFRPSRMSREGNRAFIYSVCPEAVQNGFP